NLKFFITIDMKLLFSFLIIIILLLVFPFESHTNINSSSSLISKTKFFIKTKNELKISEATGKISLVTGIQSLDEKIIRYKITGINRLFNLNNGDKTLYEKFGMARIYLVSIDANFNLDIVNVVEDFKDDGNIDFCEPDYIGISAGVKEIFQKNPLKNNLPNDEVFYKQWYLQNLGSVEPSSSGGYPKRGADNNILNAWEIEKGREEVIIAILDSGIKDDHPDLRNRIWINKNEIPNNNIDDDQNGYIDDYKGWDFAYNDKRGEDGFGHGTNIATVIGASTNNMIGFAGVDQRCRLMNCKNLNADNSGEYSWWAESIKYAVDNGAKIINMSEGGDDYSEVLKTAVEYANESGVMLNAAMMNKGDGRDYYPASYKAVFAVGATDTDDRRCKRFSWGGGSCWGKHISVVAPGNKIYGLDYENDESYEVYWSGTSQSTAIISGIAALLLAQDKLRTNDDLKKIIKYSSKDLVGDPKEDREGWDQYYGFGRVDSYAALNYDNKNPVMKEDEIKKDELEKKQEPTMEETQDDNIKSSDKDSDEKPAKARQRNSDDR
ncbi:MAG: S8 family serine peptidase, partial [Ignavibacteriaceae bacterium]